MTRQKKGVEPDHTIQGDMPDVYEAALQAAIELLSRFPDEPKPDRYFAEKLDYQIFLNSMQSENDPFLPQFVRRFGNEPDFQRAVLAAAAQVLATGGALPKPVREYASQFLQSGAKVQGRPGKHPRENRSRDVQICLAVAKVTREFDFRATRNDATKYTTGKESACSIVSRALEVCGIDLNEAAVAQIWKRVEHIRD